LCRQAFLEAPSFFASRAPVELGYQLLLVEIQRWAGFAQIEPVGRLEKEPKKKPDNLIWFRVVAWFVNLQNPPTQLTS